MKKTNNPRIFLKAALLFCSIVSMLPVTGHAQNLTALSEPKQQSAKLAITTLSKQLSIDPADISVIHVSIMDWPDSSLGCPKPGNQYLQVITRGSLVLLRADMKAYRVHIGNNRAIICNKPNKNILPLGKTTTGSAIQNIMLQARKDLAEKLGVSVTKINTTKIESKTWPNSALGCAVNGLDDQRSDIKGFRIVMEYKGREFSYHTDQQRTIPCPPIEMK